MIAELEKFDWSEEIHKIVTHSLATSFGLDFLLFDDKKGGDVDTIHNVRQGIYATEKEQERYFKNENYNSNLYHNHKNYKNKGVLDKELQKEGKLYDAYQDKFLKTNSKRDLDHVISAKEIHDDAGRVLSGLSGVELANKSSNLQSTSSTVNRSKKQTATEEYLNKLPGLINSHKLELDRKKDRLSKMSKDNAEQRHKANQLRVEIQKNSLKIKELESIDKKKMLSRDKEARGNYNKIINSTYYSSSKLLQNTAISSVKTGTLMGTRQALGLVLAEVWFELREQIPALLKKLKNNFQISSFLEHLRLSIKGIYERVKVRFRDLLVTFKDSALGGMLSSITTTIFNIFLTTHRVIGKMIRETFNSLSQAIKLIFFNPDKLSLGQLAQEVTKILLAALSVAAGGYIHQHLNNVLIFPFGSEISAFISALVTGILTVGFSYFLDHSEIMKKVWSFLDQFKSKYKHTTEYYQKVNAELDRYMTELAKVEFNMNPVELKVFADSLISTNDEYERSLILGKEIEKRGIDLPFEIGNIDSTRKWLDSL